MKNISLLSMKYIFPKAESILFYFIVFLHCLPVLLFKFFVTHDGPAHVYNAYLIKTLLFNSDALTADFYSLRSFPEANWIGHAGMLLLDFLVSPVTGERILLLIYIVFLPVAFRRVILLTNPGSRLLSYFIFPFIYSYAFYGGLYNFMLGIPLLLFALQFLFKIKMPLRSSVYIFLFVTGLLLYFSHLVVFGIYVLLVPVLWWIKNHYAEQRLVDETQEPRKQFFRITVVSLLMFLPGLLLSISFIFEKASFHTNFLKINFPALFHDLAVVLPIITLSDKGEHRNGFIFGFVLLLLIVYAIYFLLKNRKQTANKKIVSNGLPVFWFTASILMLLFYFVIPDDFATGGVVKVRFAYFFFLFIILWIASQRIHSTILKYAASVVVLLSLFRLAHFTNSSRQLSKDAEVFYSASEFIEPNSIVLPLNYSTNWMHSNISNYLGTANHTIVLDNYEAGREHFPLTWKENRNPVVLMGSFNGKPPLCADVSEFENKTARSIDYIILWRDAKDLSDSCTSQIQSTLKNKYKLCFKSLDKQLYMYQRMN